MSFPSVGQSIVTFTLCCRCTSLVVAATQRRWLCWGACRRRWCPVVSWRWWTRRTPTLRRTSSAAAASLPGACVLREGVPPPSSADDAPARCRSPESSSCSNYCSTHRTGVPSFRCSCTHLIFIFCFCSISIYPQLSTSLSIKKEYIHNLSETQFSLPLVALKTWFSITNYFFTFSRREI